MHEQITIFEQRVRVLEDNFSRLVSRVEALETKMSDAELAAENARTMLAPEIVASVERAFGASGTIDEPVSVRRKR